MLAVPPCLPVLITDLQNELIATFVSQVRSSGLTINSCDQHLYQKHYTFNPEHGLYHEGFKIRFLLLLENVTYSLESTLSTFTPPVVLL